MPCRGLGDSIYQLTTITLFRSAFTEVKGSRWHRPISTEDVCATEVLWAVGDPTPAVVVIRPSVILLELFRNFSSERTPLRQLRVRWVPR
jgi:hypothetical protein